MSRFITEKETESYLEYSSRLLTMPNGSSCSVSAMKLTWDYYDFILSRPSYSESIVMDFARRLSEDENIDFDLAFDNVVGYIGNRLREILGVEFRSS